MFSEWAIHFHQIKTENRKQKILRMATSDRRALRSGDQPEVINYMFIDRRISFLSVALLLVSATVWASITGSISGVVTDSSGALISGATVVATDIQTGVKTSVTTDTKGFYSLPALAIGTYDLEISQPGFKTYRKTGLVIDANAALRADASLHVGATSEKVEVTTDTVHVETQSTQMGEVIEGKKIAAVPLNGRRFTDLLALQPGGSPYTATSTGTPGLGDRQPSGGLNGGNQAINGQRESANGFMVNGSNVEEGKNNGTSIIPNLDSIDEFRIITNNFDAEYGNYSGGQINVATKSGANHIHGDAFEFLRHTDFDPRNYFNPAHNPNAAFNRNQFASTLGGPIKRYKMFFFVDYQGSREIVGSTETLLLPSLLNRAGNFSDVSSSLTTTQTNNGGQAFTVPTTVSSNFSNLLTNRLQSGGVNHHVTSGEPYYFTAGEAIPQTDPIIWDLRMLHRAQVRRNAFSRMHLFRRPPGRRLQRTYCHSSPRRTWGILPVLTSPPPHPPRDCVTTKAASAWTGTHVSARFLRTTSWMTIF